MPSRRAHAQVPPTIALRDGEEVAKMSGADPAKLEALVKEHQARRYRHNLFVVDALSKKYHSAR